MGFFARRLIPRKVRQLVHLVRAVKRAVTPKPVKRLPHKSSQQGHSGDFPSQTGLVTQLGYTRVSTSSQDAQLQLDALVAAGVQQRDVLADVTSGSRTAIERLGRKKGERLPKVSLTP